MNATDNAGGSLPARLDCGELNSDATEIAGIWTIGSGFSGEFVMTRPGRNTKVRERRKLATVSS